MPMDKVLAGIMLAAQELSVDGGAAAARAIMTTDTVPKHGARPIRAGGQDDHYRRHDPRGAGMIAPQLVPAEKHATMLAYLTTDAALEPGLLQACLTASLDASFNRINIDGDTSTNDTFIALANGAADNTPIRADSFEAERFQQAFDTVAGELARQMVLDGEGVTRFVELHVSGARSRDEARRCARAIADSLLVKTAWFGADPNWGRILCAAGYCGVHLNPGSVRLDYQGVPVVRNGMDAGTPEPELVKAIDRREFRVDLDLGAGAGDYTMWTNDLSYEYVKINADYHT